MTIKPKKKEFEKLHIEIINNDPAKYREFIDNDYFENYNLKNTIKKVKQLLKGRSPEEDAEPGADPDKTAAASDPNSLKNMPQNKINAAMNFLRQQSGLPGGDLFAKQTAAAISTVSKNAGPQRRNFEERDAPVINKIKDELAKLLNGDFSNLIKEGNLDSWNEETREKLKSALKELVADKFADNPEKADKIL